MPEQIHIDNTSFGQITINGQIYDYDVVIRSTGGIVPRKKHFAQSQFGTSHKVPIAEVEDLLANDQFETLVVGNGQNGVLEFLPETQKFLEQKSIQVIIQPTPEAIQTFNRQVSSSLGRVAGLFHLTC